MSKRIISLLCLVLSIVMLIGGCGGAVAASKSVILEQVEGDGTFGYDVVRSGDKEIATDTLENKMKDLRKAIKDGLDLKVVLQRDTQEDYDGKYELLVGTTNREESAEALRILTENRKNHAKDFIIKVIGEKICIQAVTEDRLLAAVDLFIDTFCGSREDWAKLGKDFEYIYAPESTGKHIIDDVQFGEFKFITPEKPEYIYNYYCEEVQDLLISQGYVVSVGYDTEEAVQYEVLVGDVNRPEAKSVQLTGNDYVIKVVGTKLVLKGATSLATSYAVQKLIEMIKEKPDGINLADGFVYNGTTDENPDGYKLVVSDDFNGSTFNRNVWTSSTCGGATDGSADRVRTTASLYGGVVYYYGLTGCYVADGNAVLTAARLDDINFYQSGFTSQNMWKIRYGIIEYYAKVAESPVGTSLWMNGWSCEGGIMNEINIVEIAGRTHGNASNFHTWGSARGVNDKYLDSFHTSLDGTTYGKMKKVEINELISADYHRFSAVWDKDGLHCALDGKTYFDFYYADWEGGAIGRFYNTMHFLTHLGEATYSSVKYDREKHATYFETYLDSVRVYQDSYGAIVPIGMEEEDVKPEDVAKYVVS